MVLSTASNGPGSPPRTQFLEKDGEAADKFRRNHTKSVTWKKQASLFLILKRRVPGKTFGF